MSIIYNSEQKVFHLQSETTSYIIQVHKSGHVAHVYWGNKVKSLSFNTKAITYPSNYNTEEIDLNPDIVPQEYPGYGRGDYRGPAYQVQLENGTTVTDLRYDSHNIYKGKKALEGLPATYVENDQEAESLEIIMKDKVTGLKATLTYTVFNDLNVTTRSVRLTNDGDKSLKLLSALSASVDFDNYNYDFLQLSGAWTREKHVYKRALVPGLQAVDSKKGITSHQQSPFIALVSKNADESYGEVYGFNLVYSGNFLAQAEVDQFGYTRVSMGINPFDFTWLLESGESFQAPEVVMVYSSKGLGEMSRTYHKLYRTRLARGKYRDAERPILINNWEATYFNFNASKLEEIATTGKKLGMELFVLDDGWFGKRDIDNCSLGDWVVDKKKLPDGLDNLAKKINDIGLSFGLWFEPEMVSPDSDLYRKHPDWCIHVPDIVPSQGKYQRNQLVLDLSRKDVCDEIIRMVSEILKNAPISYVKWDMNRGICDSGSEILPPNRQREIAHRYVLGLYRVMNEITSAFPNVLFESCCSGGGRFDPGILYYMPQTWTSDDTDAVERLKIQYGTSLAYPAISMGSHVSTCPNHQVGRTTPLDTRAAVAMAGNFGYELDLTKFTEDEFKAVKEQVKLYKEIRHIVQFGELYRLMNPFEGNETAWMHVSEDKKEAVVTYVKVLAEPNTFGNRIKLQGLMENYNYEVVDQNMVVGGDELMYIGLDTGKLSGDFASMTWRIRAV